jgi:hypothetical protein
VAAASTAAARPTLPLEDAAQVGGRCAVGGAAVARPCAAVQGWWPGLAGGLGRCRPRSILCRLSSSSLLVLLPRQQPIQQLLPSQQHAAVRRQRAAPLPHVPRLLCRRYQELLDGAQLLSAAGGCRHRDGAAQVAEAACLGLRAGTRGVVPHHLHGVGVLAHRKLRDFGACG